MSNHGLFCCTKIFQPGIPSLHRRDFPEGSEAEENVFSESVRKQETAPGRRMEAVRPEFYRLLQAEKRPQGKQARRRKKENGLCCFSRKNGEKS